MLAPEPCLACLGHVLPQPCPLTLYTTVASTVHAAELNSWTLGSAACIAVLGPALTL